MKNIYIRRSRISEEDTLKMLSGFAYDLTAAETARKVHLTPKTVKVHFANIRRRIQHFYREQTNDIFTDTGIEPGILMNNNTEGRFSFTLLKHFRILSMIYIHQDGLYLQTELICSRSETLYKELESKLLELLPNEIEGFGFADLKFQRIPELTYISGGSESHSQNTTIENFWNFANYRRKKFRSIDVRTAYYHLKEAEWRYKFVPPFEKAYYDTAAKVSISRFQRAKPESLFFELTHIIKENPL